MTKKIVVGSLVEAADNAEGVVVIIDVFRAFTTAAIALANGADRIVMVDTLEQALSLRDQGIGDLCIGERHGIKPDGFDFGNSPSEILEVAFEGKILIQTTSNGTRGILAAKRATRIYAGALVTAEALIERLESGDEDTVSLIAMGNGAERADEDELCALYLRSRLNRQRPDVPALKKLISTLSTRTDGTTLSAEDLECCLDVDKLPFAIRIETLGELQIATREDGNQF